MSRRLTTNYDIATDGLTQTDVGATSIWLKPPTLLAGGAGLVSTARDFARFGAMLLGEGKLERVRVMQAQTARSARSNLLPPGVEYKGGGFGAGARAALPAGADPRLGPAGSFGGGGAAGTLWRVDPARRGIMVFMTQIMGYPPDAYPIPDQLAAAIETDLASGERTKE